MDSAKPAKPSYVGSNRNRRKLSTGSLKEAQIRSLSEGTRATQKKRNVSRESSTGSSAMSLDVRCGCQYFQSDTLLPEKKKVVGSRPTGRANLVVRFRDHEYEPINPPDDVTTVSPMVHVIDNKTSKQNQDTYDDQNQLHSEDEGLTAEEMQTHIEDRFFNMSSERKPNIRAEHQHLRENTPESVEKKPNEPSKFQQTIKTQTDKFKTKWKGIKKPTINLPQIKKPNFQGIKKPNITLPNRPKFKKPNFDKLKKIERPKFHLPKMPEKMHLPSFSLPRKTTKQSLKETRQFSTESNAGDSRKPSLFDFSTYPRIFKRKQSDGFDSSSLKNDSDAPTEFATVPRTSRNNKEDSRKPKDLDKGGIIRIPLHSEDSMETGDRDNSREDSLERRMASHNQYDKDIDIDDDYERENQEIHMVSPFSKNFSTRWNHGSFHPDPNIEYQNGTDDKIDNRDYKVTDLDSPEDFPSHHESFDTQNSKDIHSSQSSFGLRKRGVLEEINSDEFFLRQKGISQEYIDSGKYLSSEIREAFTSPMNALSQIEYYDTRASNQSLPETPSKRKPKKPKRKKTPHVSQEQIPYDQEESELDDNQDPPSRPKRRSKRRTKNEVVVPYQETIPVDIEETFDNDHHIQKMLEREIIQSELDYPEDNQYKQMYENEQMEGKDQPEIQITDPYKYSRFEHSYDAHLENDHPPAPPKRQKSRSLKSLTFSEQESILGEFQGSKQIPASQNIEVYKMEHEYRIPPEDVQDEYRSKSLSYKVPERPLRNRSRTRSQSLVTSQGDDDITSRGAESINSENQIPCIEEPCIQDVRDSMGYAVVDKNKVREPPLPPPKVPSRNRRPKSSQSSLISETKFSTVPRAGVLSDEPPVRPLRNYSTLGPSRSGKGKKIPNLTDEEKENIDITQYIEIEDEPNRDLHSGEVIQKMRDRPLPAPPRPPRKGRVLRDITSEENIASDSMNEINKVIPFEETEVSTQTEPLSDDFVCEEVVQEVGDRLITPTTQQQTISQNTPTVIERRLITPTEYTHEETITHGSLLVEPLNGAKILRESEFSRIERRIPITKDYSDEETSEIPEDFKKLRDPIKPKTTTMQPSEMDILKTQKLQVSDLDVDRLTVNELLANKIIVSEIDSSTIQTNEISSKSGAVKIGEIELPPSILQQLFEKLQSVAQHEQSSIVQTPEQHIRQSPQEKSSDDIEEMVTSEEKKTSIEPLVIDSSFIQENEPSESIEYKKIINAILNNPPQRPPRQTNLLKNEEILENNELTDLKTDEIPIPPPRNITSLEYVESEEECSVPPPSLNTPLLASETSSLQKLVDYSNQDIIDSIERAPSPPPRTIESSSQEPSISREGSPDSKLTQSTIVVEELIPAVTERLTGEEDKPLRPPRHSTKPKTDESDINKEESNVPLEPEVDDEPPPRPPQPNLDYIPSQPPASFYALRAQQYVDDFNDDIPMAPRRRRHHKAPPISRSSSEEDGPTSTLVSRRRYRSPEPSIPHLTGQLMQACGNETRRQIKRLISHITSNVLGNADGKQDMHVMMIILLVLIVGLLLLSNNGQTIHYHHWEFFNPPRDL